MEGSTDYLQHAISDVTNGIVLTATVQNSCKDFTVVFLYHGFGLHF